MRATPAHYIYASGCYIPARDAKVGDALERTDDSKRAVTSVRTVMNKELYNLLTVHGGIISVRTATSKDVVLSRCMLLLTIYVFYTLVREQGEPWFKLGAKWYDHGLKVEDEEQYLLDLVGEC